MLAVGFLTLGATLFGSLHADEANGAVAVVKSFRTSLEKGQAQDAVKHIASFPGVPREMSEEEVARCADIVKTGAKLWIFPQGSKVQGECAMVTVGDGEEPSPDDPFYLIRQDGRWKFLPGLTRWNEQGVVLTDGEKKIFAELEKFHDTFRKKFRDDPDLIVE